MTVWAKLQSWLGAAASDVAIDNEFNNIYLGLNEAANGNLPSGYNKAELTFTGASLTIKGETKIGNVNVELDSTLTVSGAAGWRYIVTTNGGVMSVESIPPAEITADTQQYTPTPVFNTAANGYYSTVNTARRIVGVCYFDTTIKEVIAYGIGKRKNDDYYYSPNAGVGNNTTSGRFQFTASFDKSRGTNISVVDNGAGTSDSEGFRITSLGCGKLRISGSVAISSASGVAVNLNKNGASYYVDFFDATVGGGVLLNSSTPFCFYLPVQKNDYFVFNMLAMSAGNASINNIEILFEEF